MNVRKSESGATFVEFSVAIPVLIMLVMGLVQLSIILYSSISVNNCAVATARYAITESSDSAVTTFANNLVDSLVGNSTPTITLDRTPDDVNGNPLPLGSVQVDIAYNVPLIVPARLLGSSSGDFQVTGRSIMQ